MVLHEFTYPSADGKTNIHAVEWLPGGEVKAVLQIAHGMAEHARRYDNFATFLNKNGYIGSSTKSEIEYAKANGKAINYLEPID